LIKATKIIFNSINNGISVSAWQLASTYGEAAFKELNEIFYMVQTNQAL
jgi:hypothetical protein